MLLDCTVAVNGTRYNDGTGRPPGDPSGVILSGLKLIWGRSTTIDQPQPATCTFTVADWTGTPAGLSAFPIGAPVDVDAAGIDYGAPTDGTFTDPTLTRTAPVTTSRSGTVVALQVDGAGVTLTPKLPVGNYTGYFRPDDPDPSPSAWVTIPRLIPGQTWQARVAGRAPYGAKVIPALVGFDTPAAAGRTLNRWTGLSSAGAFDHTVTFTAVEAWGTVWAGVGAQTLDWATWTTLPALGPLTWGEQPQTWLAMTVTTIDAVEVLAPTPARELSVRVFSGRVTDVTAAWDAALGALVAEVTSADFTADLANRRVAAEPWPTETASARVGRILTASGAPIAATIDPSLGGYLIARQDVDAQSPTALLEDVAVSVDAVMWAATSAPTGPYLHFEDVSARATGRVLTQIPGGLVVIRVDARALDALTLDTCAVIRDPVAWRQDTADVITRVASRWLELGTDTDGKPTETEHTEWVTDTTAEAVNGVRTVSVGTQLTNQPEALTIGTAIASRVFGSGWRIDGLTVDELALADLGTVGGVSPATVLAQLLDGTARNGLLAHLTNLPAWAPNHLDAGALVYLEGGAYEFADDEWTLALVTSDPRGQGTSATWEDLDPTWTWAMFDPAVTWASLYGASVVEAVTSTPAWPGLAYPGMTYPGTTTRREPA